jgi:plasmid stabilization system protein ParE
MKNREYLFLPVALNDISRICAYFDDESDYKVDRFYNELIEEVKYVSQMPRSRRKYHKYFRVVFMPNFPFAIIYSLNKNVIYIHAVRSTKQDLKRVFYELSRRR